jgi:hypothetical protein
VIAINTEAQLNILDNKIWLTTGQAAQVKGINERSVRRLIQSRKLVAVQTENPIRGGKAGQSYLIPISALTAKEQAKYWRILKQKSKELVLQLPEPTQPKPLDTYSLNDRKIIEQWIEAIRAWRRYRSNYPKQMVTVDEEWLEKNRDKYDLINLSADNLYRRWKALRENDYDALIDKRGRWSKGTTSIPELAWELFKYFYLDEAQHPVSKCVQYVGLYLEKEKPELLPTLPSYHSFHRALKNIPFAVVKLFREGDKAFEDEASPYISRMYEDLEVGEVWVADAHTFDVISIEDGKVKFHRLTVISFMDVRSRIITGWHITEHPSSEGVLYALRKGILRYGIPKYAYVDNGKEFLCFDIGGRGHRKTRKGDEHTPPGVFARLGIEMWNARVRNAKAKTIERTHKEFKENFSRLIAGFCGGSPAEKPENLKKTLKTKKDMLLDSELIQNFNIYIEGIYNEAPSKGMGMYGRSPIEVYNEELISKRTATEEDLNLLLMRSTRMQTVGRKGVQLELYGEKLFYWTPDFLIQYQQQKVYVRYDPEDLRDVRVYNANDEYLCTVPCDDETILKYGSSKEDVKKAHQKIRSFKKIAQSYSANSGLEAYDKINALSLMLWKGQQNIENRAQKGIKEAKVIHPVRANEPLDFISAPAEDDFTETIQRMVENSKRNTNAI